MQRIRTLNGTILYVGLEGMSWLDTPCAASGAHAEYESKIAFTLFAIKAKDLKLVNYFPLSV